MADSKWSVDGCGQPAAVEVRLYDVYPDGTIFDERDYTCPFLCPEHLRDKELKAQGERKPRGFVRYPYTNQHGAQGFTIYRPINGSSSPAPSSRSSI